MVEVVVKHCCAREEVEALVLDLVPLAGGMEVRKKLVRDLVEEEGRGHDWAEGVEQMICDRL